MSDTTETATVETEHRNHNGQAETVRRVTVDGDVHEWTVDPDGYEYQGDGDPPADAIRALRAWHAQHDHADHAPDPPAAPASRDRPGADGADDGDTTVLARSDQDVTPPDPREQSPIDAGAEGEDGE